MRAPALCREGGLRWDLISITPIDLVWYPEKNGGEAAMSVSIAKALKESFPYVRALQSL